MGRGARVGGRAGLGNRGIACLVLGLLVGLCHSWARGPDGLPGAPRGAPSFGVRPPDLQALLPENEGTGAWTRDGDAQEFAGEDLYLYIDGGAAIYQEYGFVRVISQDYKTRGGQGLSLEIFQMATPEGAYGMFTFKRSAGGEVIPVGAEGQLEGYYLNFWKGCFLVTITSFDKDERARQQLVPMALAVARRVPDGGGQPPALITKLPRPRLLGTSVRYFRGYLGFTNHFPSAAARDFQVQEGVSGDYASGASLFILKCSGPEEARARLAAVEKTISKSGTLPVGGAFPDGSFSATDDKGKKITLRAEGGYILLCIEDPSGSDAPGLFAAAGRNLR